MESEIPDVESAVLDLSGVSLESLRAMEGPAIAASLERLMQHIDRPPAVMASGYGGAQRID